MLLTPQQVNHAMSLSVNTINDTLKSSGYNDTVRDARFKGATPGGSYVYEVTYYTLDREMETCGLYMQFREDPVTQKFALTAEY